MMTSQDNNELTTTKSKFNWPVAVVAISVLAAVISAAAAILCWIAMLRANLLTTQNAEDDLYQHFQATLTQLINIEQLALSPNDSKASTGCSGDGCLGSLAFGESYFNQYELLALEAATSALKIRDRMTDWDQLQLAKALFIAGRLNDCEKYMDAAVESDDPLISFRAKLLQAQVAFLREDMANGRRMIQEALKALSGNTIGLSETEIRLKQVQAHLTGASMQIALGKREESVESMKEAYRVLQSLPRTTRRQQLDEMLRGIMTSYIHGDESTRAKTFEQFEEEIRKAPNTLASAEEPSFHSLFALLLQVLDLLIQYSMERMGAFSDGIDGKDLAERHASCCG